ncbi:MAG: hypothetical protein HPY75_03440 [Actinobacteria bacterium]|nr:hypothetical protein [Actinomycetota bacterium]
MPFSILALHAEDGTELLKHLDTSTEEHLITHYFSHPTAPRKTPSWKGRFRTTSTICGFSRRDIWMRCSIVPFEEWSYVYNDVRPHLSLGYLIPIEFLSQWMEEDYLAGACPPWSKPGHALVIQSPNMDNKATVSGMLSRGRTR